MPWQCRHGVGEGQPRDPLSPPSSSACRGAEHLLLSQIRLSPCRPRHFGVKPSATAAGEVTPPQLNRSEK